MPLPRLKLTWGSKYGVFPKNRGKTHQIIHFYRVFHYFHHPFWVFSPYFWKHPYHDVICVATDEHQIIDGGIFTDLIISYNKNDAARLVNCLVQNDPSHFCTILCHDFQLLISFGVMLKVIISKQNGPPTAPPIRGFWSLKAWLNERPLKRKHFPKIPPKKGACSFFGGVGFIGVKTHEYIIVGEACVFFFFGGGVGFIEGFLKLVNTSVKSACALSIWQIQVWKKNSTSLDISYGFFSKIC